MYVQKYNDTVIDRVTPFYLLLYSTTLRTLLISTKQALRENDALKYSYLILTGNQWHKPSWNGNKIVLCLP